MVVPFYRSKNMLRDGKIAFGAGGGILEKQAGRGIREGNHDGGRNRCGESQTGGLEGRGFVLKGWAHGVGRHLVARESKKTCSKNSKNITRRQKQHNDEECQKLRLKGKVNV